MTALELSSARIAVRPRRGGWIARAPGGIVAALRATLIYGEAQRFSPPPG
jgi:hypothetical protein